MADNVAITAGAGTSVATDDVSSVHFQKVKLDYGGNGVSLPFAKAGTATLSNVGDEVSSTTVLAANTARLGATLVNDSTSECYVKFGSTASATSYTVKMAPYAYYEVPALYTGIITAIWITDAGGSMRVTELTE